MATNIITHKRGLIENIVFKFQGNSLLSKEVKNVLNLFDVEYLDQLNTALGKFSLDQLNGADNRLDEELTSILNDNKLSKEAKDNFRKLREHMVKLQLNILLSNCSNKNDQKVFIPLIQAINNKLSSVNNIIDILDENKIKRQETKKPEEIKIQNIIEEEIVEPEIKSENIIQEEIEPESEQIKFDNIIEEDEVKKPVVISPILTKPIKNTPKPTIRNLGNAVKNSRLIYPRLTNRSHNYYLKFVNGIIDQLIALNAKIITVEDFTNFITQGNFLDIYGKLVLNSIPRIRLSNYHRIISEYAAAPKSSDINKNQSTIMYLMYDSLLKILNNVSTQSKKDSVDIFINNFIQYWEAEAFHNEKGSLNKAEAFPGFENSPVKNEEPIQRDVISVAVFDKIKKLARNKKLLGGGLNYYHKYLKYKSKYLTLKVKR
jgi:hypothetical protein